MGRPTAERIAEQALHLELVTPEQLQEVWGALGTRSVGLDEFVQALVRREHLTKYQVDRILKGEKSGYFYGDYKVLYLVGTGTFARVFRAAHRRTGKIVAIKVLRERFSTDPAQYGLFVREGELGHTLLHPNIVPIVEVHSRGKQHFLVMEFVEGRSLREFVRVRKALNPKEATRLMADIARGLDYAFHRSMTHRDLRMANVLISSEGRAMLADFGLAAMEQSTAENSNGEASAARTIDYAALERATGVRKADSRSDIYFAGCIYYHMLSGQSPLDEGATRVQRMSKSRFSEVVPIQQLVPPLPLYVTYIVNKAMALDPARRYQTPGEMLAELESAMGRLEAGLPAGDEAETAAGGEDAQRRVMVVESSLSMQDLLREGLKRGGYRVLLTRDPQRAYDRLTHEEGLAECVIFSAQEIGLPAVECFNRMPEHPWTRSLPSLLLLGENQHAWAAQAQTSDRRRVLLLPVTMKLLRVTLGQILADPGAAGPSAGDG